VTDAEAKPTAGYSDTPLAQKLGLKPGQWVCYVNHPDHFEELLGELPSGITVRSQLRGPLDLIVCFVTSRLDLARRLPALQRALHPNGMLWIAWPKRSSGVETDVTEDHIRDAALPSGLVDTKVCAIDETWSGLRLVTRKELR
jgi:Protein of unknown function (DUF3052)